jgi:hypothetical protein
MSGKYSSGFTPGGSGAPGGLFHWVTKTADGFRVIDVWESRQQFERFSKEKIGPLAAEVGFPGQPADSGGWRSAFRSDGDHDSEVMPISIPN